MSRNSPADINALRQISLQCCSFYFLTITEQLSAGHFLQSLIIIIIIIVIIITIMLKYHHCRSLDSVIYGEVRADPKYTDPDFKDAYSWLEREVGFYPLFLAVGTTEEDIRMTGYQNQWRRLLSIGFPKNEHRKKGEFPNDVLFSFEEVEGIFMDYTYWILVLNSGHKNYQMTDYETRLVFKPSWATSAWLRKARKDPSSIQLVIPRLYLPDSQRIWVRNQQTKALLISMGFGNVETKRLLLEEPERI